MEWIDIKKEPPDFDRIHFLVDGDSVYIRGSLFQPIFYQLCGEMKKISDCNWTHWMPFPYPPKQEGDCP